MRQLKRMSLKKNESLRRMTSWQFWPEYSSIVAAAVNRLAPAVACVRGGVSAAAARVAGSALRAVAESVVWPPTLASRGWDLAQLTYATKEVHKCVD